MQMIWWKREGICLIFCTAKLLTSVYSTLYAYVEFRRMQPVDYKLFQGADLVCTMELLAEKAESNSFS